MTSRADHENAATNADILLMFVAAMRAVAPDLFEAFLPSEAHRAKRQYAPNVAGIGPATECLEFKSGMDVWIWVTERYETLASLVCRLSEEQRTTTQNLLDGMLQELRVANLVDLAGQKDLCHQSHFHSAF